MMPYQSEQILKSVLSELFQQYKNDHGVSSNRVSALYRQTMGDYISKHTTRIFLKNGMLHLYIDIPSLRHELSLGKEKLRLMLNDALGEVQVKEIQFH
jgi:hypothetical protein